MRDIIDKLTPIGFDYTFLEAFKFHNFLFIIQSDLFVVLLILSKVGQFCFVATALPIQLVAIVADDTTQYYPYELSPWLNLIETYAYYAYFMAATKVEIILEFLAFFASHDNLAALYSGFESWPKLIFSSPDLTLSAFPLIYPESADLSTISFCVPTIRAL
jgi:hypothetical protein